MGNTVRVGVGIGFRLRLQSGLEVGSDPCWGHGSLEVWDKCGIRVMARVSIEAWFRHWMQPGLDLV